MKKIFGLIIGLLFVVGGMATNSSAQTGRHPHSVNSRERRQQKRIYNGVKTGQLTPRETFRLERRQAQIRRAEARYRRSGDGLSRRERYKLERGLNRSSRSIYRQKHDKQSVNYTKRRL